MAKVGDSKTCRLCGNHAILRRVPESTSGPVAEGGVLPPVLPAYHAWECRECGYREPFTGVLED